MAAPSEGVRRVATRIRTTLRAAAGWLATELSEQALTWADVATLLVVPADRDVVMGDRMMPHEGEFPCIYIVPRSGEDHGKERLHGYKDVVHTIEVQIALAHTDEDLLQLALWIYMRAVEKVLEDRVRTGDEIWLMRHTSYEFSPIGDWEGRGYVQAVALRSEYTERVVRPSTV